MRYTADLSTPVTSTAGVNCVLTCGVGGGGASGLGLRLGGLDFAAGPAWASTVMVVAVPAATALPAAALRGLRSAWRALGHRAAERRGVDRAIRHGDDGADLGQVGVVQRRTPCPWR